MISEPQPQFVNSDSDDPFMSQLMVTLDIAAMVVVRSSPTMCFRLAYRQRAGPPQRLRLDSELLDQLTGVAALAAPAIQNGLLVDELRYKASHDALTGLLNRVGFRQRIDGVLSSVGTQHAPVGLLFVDLDDFKQVNDIHGHDFGDELLRQAAERLAAIGRGGDEVAGSAGTSSPSSWRTSTAMIRFSPRNSAYATPSWSRFCSARSRSRSASVSEGGLARGHPLRERARPARGRSYVSGEGRA